MPPVETIDRRGARRLALARAGFLGRRYSGLPERAQGAGRRAREAALAVVRRFGYLQLDSVSVAGARSHAIVLASRLEGMAPRVGENLLAPGTPLFEYWGHEASWLPIELYPVFAFRRRGHRTHPWWGDVLSKHPEIVDRVLRHVEAHGPVRAADFDDPDRRSGWWQFGPTKRVLSALWSAGDLAIRERRGFQRWFDLPERVIPERWRAVEVAEEEALATLLERALAGHGWATTSTLKATWRIRRRGSAVTAALAGLVAEGRICPCRSIAPGHPPRDGWIRTVDLERLDALRRCRPRPDRGVLLSPFDPLLWDRARVDRFFGFEQVLEIYKPASQRRFGYYCLPVLAGDRLVGRVDLKADRRGGRLEVRAVHTERPAPTASERAAIESALDRWGRTVELARSPPS